MIWNIKIRQITSLSHLQKSQFHTSNICNEIRLLSRLRVVDNSQIGRQAIAEGKLPRCLHVYNKKKVGYLGKNLLKQFIDIIKA